MKKKVLAVTATFALFFCFFIKLFLNDEFYVTLAMSPAVLNRAYRIRWLGLVGFPFPPAHGSAIGDVTDRLLDMSYRVSVRTIRVSGAV